MPKRGDFQSLLHRETLTMPKRGDFQYLLDTGFFQDKTPKLKDLCFFGDVTLQIDSPAKLDWDKQDEWQKNANSYRLKLGYHRRSISFDYWQGTGIKHEPECASVLDSLLSDASAGEMDFHEFCSEFGDDPDSRKAERTWKACKALNKKLKRLLGGDYDIFQNAER